MGIVLAKFRKEKTTAEVLENLEERIQQIEKFSQNTQEQKKRFVGNFLATSIGIYVLAFLIFYFVYFPPTWKERIVYSVPLFLFPVFIVFLRKAFTWYFQRKLNKNSSQLYELRAEKKKLLEQVMDKETYKVAVNLLARFGDKTNGTKSTTALTPRISSTTPARSSQSLRALTTHPSSQLNLSARSFNTSLAATPRQTQLGTAAGGTLSSSRQLVAQPYARSGQELRRRTAFPIVNQQNKGVFERLVDVLIGDGPQDRFAMICKECFAHNGMALKEEFDFATFRCAFCNTLNPSRKARPIAPPLPLQLGGTPNRLTLRDSSDSTSSSEDDDSEKGFNTLNVTAMSMTDASASEAKEAKEAAAKSDALHDTDVNKENRQPQNQDLSEPSNNIDELKKEM